MPFIIYCIYRDSELIKRCLLVGYATVKEISRSRDYLNLAVSSQRGRGADLY